MDLKATIASSYRNRLILIAVGTLLYAAWCLYDARIGYPEKQDIYDEYKRVQEANPENWDEVWAKKAAEEGWPEQPDKVDAWNIKTQWIQFAIVFPIGTYCLLSLALWSRRYIGAGEKMLYANGGVEVPFDKIISIDAVRWERKGIAHVWYDLGSGERRVLIDDWKYDREPSDAIFERIKKNISPDLITGLSEQGKAEIADSPGPG